MVHPFETPPASVVWVPAARFQLSVERDPVVWPPSLEVAVDTFWHEDIERHSPQFFRGPVLSLSQIHWGASVEVKAAFTDYAHFLYSRRHGVGDASLVIRPLFAAALPITADGYLVVCKMGSKTQRPGRIQCIGGTAIPSDVDGLKFRASRSASREMLEEIGMADDDPSLTSRGVVGATVDPRSGVAVVVAYDVDQTWEAFQARVATFLARERKRGKVTELDGVVRLPWGHAGIEALAKLGDIGPRYLRCLLTAAEVRPLAYDPPGGVNA